MEEPTTEGITRQDVDEALAYLGMHNPKPEIPIETTVSGHEIVAIARMFQGMEDEFDVLQQEINDLKKSS